MASKAAARRAATGISLHLEGHKELIRALDLLPAFVSFNLSKNAARAAMVPVNKAAKQNAKAIQDTGTLWRSIGIKVKRLPRLGIVWVGVGPRKGHAIQMPDGRTRDPVNYGHLVEMGFLNARTGEHVAARPWLRPAIDSKARKVLSIYVNKMRAGLIRLTEKARRQSGGKR